jgi:hypothetical protein
MAYRVQEGVMNLDHERPQATASRQGRGVVASTNYFKAAGYEPD